MTAMADNTARERVMDADGPDVGLRHPGVAGQGQVEVNGVLTQVRVLASQSYLEVGQADAGVTLQDLST